MNSSTFEYSHWVQQRMAVGTLDLGNGTVIPAPINMEGWAAPDGALFSTARDMSRLISLMFRRNQTAGGDQILDGATVAEVLSPVIMDKDGYSGFGMPWEYEYVDNFWTKSKAGELPGYRSQVALIPVIKLGVFCVGTANQDDTTSSLLTIPILKLLMPAFTEALWSLQPAVPLPENATLFTGLYRYVDPMLGNSDIEVYIQDGTMYAALTDGNTSSATMNLTQQFTPTTFRAHVVEQQECRWMNDGADTEFLYFTVDKSGKFCSSFTFMATPYSFVSKSCPDCETLTT
jgi:hypothetical protein